MKNWKQLTQSTGNPLVPRTLVEILGKQRVLVEHHKGILRYGTEEIRIGTSYGYLRIIGSELRLCCMSREQLFVSGVIHSVDLGEGQ